MFDVFGPHGAEEEREALDRLSASPGDEQVRGLLIERNLRLVVYIARKFETTGIGIETDAARQSCRRRKTEQGRAMLAPT